MRSTFFFAEFLPVMYTTSELGILYVDHKDFLFVVSLP